MYWHYFVLNIITIYIWRIQCYPLEELSHHQKRTYNLLLQK
ncbi:hypothetical protein [Salmonella phage SD-6_S16]|nr:hypothetical protein [Salmonella phage SD-6_S16]